MQYMGYVLANVDRRRREGIGYAVYINTVISKGVCEDDGYLCHVKHTYDC